MDSREQLIFILGGSIIGLILIITWLKCIYKGYKIDKNKAILEISNNYNKLPKW